MITTTLPFLSPDNDKTGRAVEKAISRNCTRCFTAVEREGVRRPILSSQKQPVCTEWVGSLPSFLLYFQSPSFLDNVLPSFLYNVFPFIQYRPILPSFQYLFFPFLPMSFCLSNVISSVPTFFLSSFLSMPFFPSFQGLSFTVKLCCKFTGNI